MSAYKVRCLDAKYDEDEGMIVMNTLFEHSGERKIVVFARQDVAQGIFKVEDMAPRDVHLFAHLMSKRELSFTLIIDDDPNRTQLSDGEMMRYGAMFNKRIAEELEKVQEGLANETGQTQRKLGRMVDEGKIDVLGLLKEEQVVRGKLG